MEEWGVQTTGCRVRLKDVQHREYSQVLPNNLNEAVLKNCMKDNAAEVNKVKNGTLKKKERRKQCT